MVDRHDNLETHADDADFSLAWPTASWTALTQRGGLRWALPRELGGDGVEGPPLLALYAGVAQACLTTCFILSQRDAACRRLRDSDRDDLCRELLPALARGERFATVGLSQLTTSRQHVQPTLTARLDGATFVLDGVIPWVTGAAHADHLVIGATLADDRQVLLVVPTDLPGVEVGPPLELMALRGSLTAEVSCHGVRVDRHWLLAGPIERVLQGGRGGGGLETSCLALGLASAALASLRHEAAHRPNLCAPVERLREKWETTWAELAKLAGGDVTAELAAGLRGRANTLVLQATQAALTASKGTGFVHPHPAQRWARQALFFLVWSCPWPAAAATLDYLTCDIDAD